MTCSVAVENRSIPGAILDTPALDTTAKSMTSRYCEQFGTNGKQHVAIAKQIS